MKDYAKSIDEMFNELPPSRQAEVRDFLESLVAKQRSNPRRKPHFDWAGALKDLRDEYTSVELQHEIAGWRTEPE